MNWLARHTGTTAHRRRPRPGPGRALPRNRLPGQLGPGPLRRRRAGGDRVRHPVADHRFPGVPTVTSTTHRPIAGEPRPPEKRGEGVADGTAGQQSADQETTCLPLVPRPGSDPAALSDATAREVRELRREMAQLRSDYARLRALLPQQDSGPGRPGGPGGALPVERIIPAGRPPLDDDATRPDFRPGPCVAPGRGSQPAPPGRQPAPGPAPAPSPGPRLPNRPGQNRPAPAPWSFAPPVHPAPAHDPSPARAPGPFPRTGDACGPGGRPQRSGPGDVAARGVPDPAPPLVARHRPGNTGSRRCGRGQHHGPADHDGRRDRQHHRAARRPGLRHGQHHRTTHHPGHHGQHHSTTHHPGP